MATVKGFFILSNLSYFKKCAGHDSLKTLESVYGKSLDFKSFSDYDTTEDEKLLRCCIRVLYPDKIYKNTEDEEIESGRFHGQSFCESAYGRAAVLLGVHNMKQGLKVGWGSGVINNIFKGVETEYFDNGPNSVKIIARNFGYSMAHYGTFWQEIVNRVGVKNPKVSWKLINPNEYEYIFTWN